MDGQGLDLRRIAVANEFRVVGEQGVGRVQPETTNAQAVIAHKIENGGMGSKGWRCLKPLDGDHGVPRPEIEPLQYAVSVDGDVDPEDGITHGHASPCTAYMADNE